MSKIAALISAFALGATAVAGTAVAAGCPMIEVAAVAPQGVGAARLFPIRGGGSIDVDETPLVSARDVVGAAAHSVDGEPGLNVRVGAGAAERVRSYTAGHVGAQLAFLVDGRVQMVLKIRDPIAGDGFWISPMDPATAKRVASAFQNCGRDPAG